MSTSRGERGSYDEQRNVANASGREVYNDGKYIRNSLPDEYLCSSSSNQKMKKDSKSNGGIKSTNEGHSTVAITQQIPLYSEHSSTVRQGRSPSYDAWQGGLVVMPDGDEAYGSGDYALKQTSVWNHFHGTSSESHIVESSFTLPDKLKEEATMITNMLHTELKRRMLVRNNNSL